MSCTLYILILCNEIIVYTYLLFWFWQSERLVVAMLKQDLEREIKFAAPNTILNQASKLDVKGKTIKTLMFIEYASHRDCTVDELFQHEISNSAFFLMDYLRKSVKSEIVIELLKLCSLIDRKVPETPPQTHAIVHDFMALVR